MTSGRLILIFIGFVIVAIILLSSNKIASSLRSKFSGVLPPIGVTGKITPTLHPSPTSSFSMITPAPTVAYIKPTSAPVYSSSSPNGEIPATGPADLAWMLLGSSATIGVALRMLSKKSL